MRKSPANPNRFGAIADVPEDMDQDTPPAAPDKGKGKGKEKEKIDEDPGDGVEGKVSIHIEVVGDWYKTWSEGRLIVATKTSQLPISLDVLVRNVDITENVEATYKYNMWNNEHLIFVHDIWREKEVMVIERLEVNLKKYINEHRYAFINQHRIAQPQLKRFVRESMEGLSHIHRMNRVLVELNLESFFYMIRANKDGISIKLNQLEPTEIAQRTSKLKNFKQLANIYRTMESMIGMKDAEFEDLYEMLDKVKEKDLKSIHNMVLKHLLFWDEDDRRVDFLVVFVNIYKSLHDTRKTVLTNLIKRYEKDIVPTIPWTEGVDKGLFAHALHSGRKYSGDATYQYDKESAVSYLLFMRNMAEHPYNIPTTITNTIKVKSRSSMEAYFRSLQPKTILTLKKIVKEANMIPDFHRYLDE